MSLNPTLPPCLADTQDPDRCRYKTRADAEGVGDLHTCTNRDGAPLQPGQVCWKEAVTQTLERAVAESDHAPSAAPAPWPADTWHGEHREDATCRNCHQMIQRWATAGHTWGSNGQLRGGQQWGTWEHTATGRAECSPERAA